MSLRFPGEIEVQRRGTDEGVGVGFDAHSPDALAERVFSAPDDLHKVMRWYRDELVRLGWHESDGGADYRFLKREDDETIELQVLPLQEGDSEWSWSSFYGRPGPFARIVFMVKGDWPPGGRPDS